VAISMKEAKLKNKLLNTLPFSIILVVCLLLYLDAGVFTYGYWNWGDSVFAFFPERMLAENFYLWNMFTRTGEPAIYTGALPFYLLITALNYLGIPLWVVSKIVYILPTAMAGWFMYLLAGSLISGRHQRESRLVAALLYMLMFWSWGNAKFTFSFAAIPLVSILFIKGMNSKRNGFLLAFLFALSLLMLTIAPAFVPLGLILILSYLVFYGVSNKWHIGSEVKSFLIPAIMLSFSFSASWILPQLDNFFAHNLAPELFSSPGDAMAVLKFTQPYTSLIWVFRLMYGYLNELASYYGMPVVIIAGFIIPIYAYSALLFHNKRKEAFCLAIMGILFTALATGIHYPLFSSVYLWLFDHMPYFHGFRIPYKFVYPLILIYACLIGLTTQGILKFCGERIAQHRLRNAVSLIAVVGILAVICIQMFPFSQRTKYSSYYISSMVVPSDYYDLHDYLAANSEPGDRLLVLSWQTWYTTYTWYTSYDQPDIVARFAPIPVLGASPDDKLQGIAKILNDEINSKNPHNMPSIVDILSMLNLRYILIHNDIPGANTSEIQLFLDDAEYFTKVGSYSNFTLLELRRECALENQFGDIYIYGIDEDYFLPYIYSSIIPAIVTGDINSLIPLFSTTYLDNYPALAFTEQQNKDSLLTVIGEGPKANEIVFVNRSFNDLVIDLAKAEGMAKGEWREAKWEIAGKQVEVESQKPVLVKLDKKGKGKFKVEGSGVYEVWIKNDEKIERFKDWGLEVNIDGEELEGWEGKEGDKWIKVGEKELEKEFDNRFNWLNWFGWFDWLKGKHRIKVESTRLEVRGNKHKAEELKKLFRDMEIVIVSKDKMKEYENLLKSKDISYLFYIDKEKIENMLKDKERLEEIKLKKENPFRIGEQEFYIPKDGNYSLKALVKPKRDFMEKGFVSIIISSSSIRALLDTLSGWDIKALNTTYKQDISEDGILINAYFQDKRDVKEYVVLTKKFPDISIKESPYLAFSSEMEDLGVQEIEIEVKLTDRSKWFSLFRTKKIRLKADNKQYVVNLYQKAKNIFGKETARNLSINKIALKFKKRDGVDLSREKDRHIYPFKFKAIAFLKTPPILIDFKDRLFAYLPDNYYYFDENGGLRSVDFPEQVPWNIKDVYRLHLNRFIDLKEIPVLSLDFSMPVMSMDTERKDFPVEWKVVLGLDFDGDEKEDERVEMFVPAAGMSGGDLLLTVPAYKEVKKRFPDKQNYKLLSMTVTHPDDKEILYQTVMSKKLIRYREYIYQPLDVRGGRLEAGGVRLEVDGKRLEVRGERQKGERQKAKGERQKANDDRRDWVEFNNIQLEEGKHTLNVFENDRFKVEMVEIKPISSISSIGFISSKERQEQPRIEFKKINPTRYVVDVKGAKGPFTLVFSESFHEGWKGYIRQVQSSKFKVQTDEPWSALLSAWEDKGSRVEIKKHFVVNGYANGWIVPIEKFKVQSSKLKVEDKEEDLKNFQIVLEFKPQRLFEIGLIISAITLLGCIGYLGYDFRKRRKNKN